MPELSDEVAGRALQALEDVERLNSENANLRAIVATRENHIAALEARLTAAVGLLREMYWQSKYDRPGKHLCRLCLQDVSSHTADCAMPRVAAFCWDMPDNAALLARHNATEADS